MIWSNVATPATPSMSTEMKTRTLSLPRGGPDVGERWLTLEAKSRVMHRPVRPGAERERCVDVEGVVAQVPRVEPAMARVEVEFTDPHGQRSIDDRHEHLAVARIRERAGVRRQWVGRRAWGGRWVSRACRVLRCALRRRHVAGGIARLRVWRFEPRRLRPLTE